jgi:hypothetical protein
MNTRRLTGLYVVANASGLADLAIWLNDRNYNDWHRSGGYFTLQNWRGTNRHPIVGRICCMHMSEREAVRDLVMKHCRADDND